MKFEGFKNPIGAGDKTDVENKRAEESFWLQRAQELLIPMGIPIVWDSPIGELREWLPRLESEIDVKKEEVGKRAEIFSQTSEGSKKEGESEDVLRKVEEDLKFLEMTKKRLLWEIKKREEKEGKE